MLSIYDHKALEAETFKELSLSLGASLSHGDDGRGVDGIDSLLELFDLDCAELSL